MSTSSPPFGTPLSPNSLFDGGIYEHESPQYAILYVFFHRLRESPEIEIGKTPLLHPSTGPQYILMHASPLNNLPQQYPPTKRSPAHRSLLPTVLHWLPHCPAGITIAKIVPDPVSKTLRWPCSSFPPLITIDNPGSRMPGWL